MTCGISVVSELFIFRVYSGNGGEGQGGEGQGVTVHGQVGHGDPDVILCKY